MNNSQNLYSNSNVDSNDKASLPKLWLFSRIICFLVALGIWIYVVNVTTQEYEKTFSLIDIVVEGSEEMLDQTNMSVVNLEESKVSITVKGLRSDIMKLTEKDFSAYIDVSKLTDGGKHSLEVSVDLPSTVSLVSKYPESVIISVDENVECEFEIDIDVTEYSMDTIYEMGTPTSDIATVRVKGPSDILNRVKAAKAFINLGTVMTSSVIRTEIVLIDKTGNSIDTTFLTMDSTSVTVVVPVTMEKTVKLVCSFLPGVDQSRYNSVKLSPETIKVKGDPKVLNEIDEVTVYALDGSQSSMLVLNFGNVLLPSGIEVLNAPTSVKIKAELKAEVTEPEETTTAPEPITEPVTEAAEPVAEETNESPVF